MNEKEIKKLVKDTLAFEIIPNSRDIKIRGDQINCELLFITPIDNQTIPVNMRVKTVETLKQHLPDEDVKIIIAYITLNNILVELQDRFHDAVSKPILFEEYMKSLNFIYKKAHKALNDIKEKHYDDTIYRYKLVIKDDLLQNKGRYL